MIAAAVRAGVARSYSLFLLLALWELACRAHWVPPQLLPAPSAVFLRLLEELGDAAFLEHFAQTLLRLFAGLGLATLLGVTIGLAGASSALGGRLLEPLVRVIAPIPKIALYPALILLLGFDHASKIALVTIDAVFPILFATYHGARRVEPRLVWWARAAGTPPAACIVKVVLPAALPAIYTGFRIALVIACIVVFLAEMISASDGLGHLLIRAARSFRTIDMFVPLVTISLLGLALDTLTTAIGRRLLAAYPEMQ